MLDGYLRRFIDPPLDRAGRALAAQDIHADTVTLAGLILGLGAAFCLAVGYDAGGLGCLIVSRLADGLDGAVARASRRTDLGGFLDIVCDFACYGAIPLAFAWRDPAGNAVAAAFLLFAFYVNGATFLAFAAVAARRGLETSAQGAKSIYFAGGLVEGTETIAACVVMTMMPLWFPALAGALGAATLVTAVRRATMARAMFAKDV